MGKDSKIEWTTHSWNPWYGGCEPRGPECANCYARRDMIRYGHDPDVLHQSKTQFNAPSKWPAGKVFVCSWSDFWLETADDLRPEAWAVMRQAPQHTYIILTKRPENIMDRLPHDWGSGWPNVWLLVSAGTQRSLGKWLPELLKVPAAVRGVSCEPLLEKINFARAFPCGYYCDKAAGHADHPFYVYQGEATGGGIHWVIVGCESGPCRRPTSLDWARDIVAQCKAAGVPVFIKQLPVDGRVSHEPGDWPEDLRVREFPH